MSIINVGDEITNYEGCQVEVQHVALGRHGILVKGIFVVSRLSFESFVPLELPPPITDDQNWYGWAAFDTLTLANGFKTGSLCLYRRDQRDTIEEYDAEWERTLQEMEDEPMGCIPLAELVAKELE